ncbi:MAG TPA: hypothetical protein VK994_02875 [Bacteroidales bacterium]|nr:hypothetical protein [Bacteroidales bacterium]
MKSHTISLINAIILIVFGIWGYFSSDKASFTAFIPVIAGLILLFLNRGIKKGNKIIGHIAVVVTLLILFGLVKPLLGSIDRNATMAIIRVSLMMLSTLFALTIFFKEFFEVRSAKK